MHFAHNIRLINGKWKFRQQVINLTKNSFLVIFKVLIDFLGTCFSTNFAIGAGSCKDNDYDMVIQVLN